MALMNFKKSIFLLFSIAGISNSFAQLNSIIVGDAINQGNNCFTITPLAVEYASETTLEVSVNPITTPIFDLINPICEGSSLNDLPTVSNNGITGFWSPLLNNLETVNYVFTPNSGQCAIETTLEIEVIPFSELYVDVDIISEPFSENQSISVSVEGGTGTYEYQSNHGLWVDTSILRNISGCVEHLIKVRDSSGCNDIASKPFAF